MKFKYQNKELELILLTYSGSRLYHTHYEKGKKEFDPDYVSDYDWKGVFIEKISDKFTIGVKPFDEIVFERNSKNDEENNIKKIIGSLIQKKGIPFEENDDMTFYEIEKFLDLSLKNNPNILDILYTPSENIIYINLKGKKLLSEKDLFLSQIIKETFIGYSESQLLRIKSHNKYLVKYPLIHIVQDKLEEALKNNDIDHNFISINFSGHIANALTEQKQSSGFKGLSFEEFTEKYSDDTISKSDFNIYKRPSLVDYTFPKTLRGQVLDMDKKVYNNKTNTALDLNSKINDIQQETKNITMKDFLIHYASFRAISKTQLNIFTPFEISEKTTYKNGIYSNNGKLKSNPPEKIGEFVCQISVDETNHKRDVDAIDKLWEWKANRNEKRSSLEKHYGYDVKHGLHLYRLLAKSVEILKTKTYTPVLSGEILQECLDIRNGKVSYEELIKKVEKIKGELENYKDSSLQEKPDIHLINKLKKDLLFETSFDIPQKDIKLRELF